MLARLAEEINTDKPIAIGQCHGKRPELKQSEQQWHGNTSKAMALGLFGNAVFLHNYRFALVMENAHSESYITEKIGNAFAAGTIPVYYGTEHIFDIFSRDAFVFMNPYHPREALAQIKHLEKNRTAYEEMLARPIFAQGERTMEQYFSMSLRGNSAGKDFDTAVAAELGGGQLLERVREAITTMPIVPWPPADTEDDISAAATAVSS